MSNLPRIRLAEETIRSVNEIDIAINNNTASIAQYRAIHELIAQLHGDRDTIRDSLSLELKANGFSTSKEDIWKDFYSLRKKIPIEEQESKLIENILKELRLNIKAIIRMMNDLKGDTIPGSTFTD